MHESGASHPGPCVLPGDLWESELYKELSRDRETSKKVSIVGQVKDKDALDQVGSRSDEVTDSGHVLEIDSTQLLMT